MLARRIAFTIAAVVLVGLVALTWTRRRHEAATPPVAVRPAAARAVPSRPTVPSKLTALTAQIPADQISPIAAELNSPRGDIHRDLQILNELFVAWETNFPHDGNPTGDNDEITLALAGDNRLHFAFIAPNHPAINARGELCDRWGTPFRFHALSATQMEIRSAGPDRKFATADDVQFAPWGNSP